jgi:NADPH:quinone reductase-like Zn-dependent oxidoreductase
MEERSSVHRAGLSRQQAPAPKIEGCLKAYRYYRYGTPDVLHLEDVEVSHPRDGEALVRIRAVSLNFYDWHCLSADIFLVRFMGGGLAGPRSPRLGVDFAGTVEAVGSGVNDCSPGDEVFGDMSACGNGAFAEYACVPVGLLAPMPRKLSFEQAAAVPMAGVSALQALRDKGRVEAGRTVLGINGFRKLSDYQRSLSPRGT